MNPLIGFTLFLQNALKYGFSIFSALKTGQVTSYVDYDDGYYQEGYPLTGARFIDNGDGTVLDLASGLMWARDGNGAGCNGGAKLSWTLAVPFAKTLNFAGYNDWRLPNLMELHGLLLNERNAISGVKAALTPYINQTHFPNTASLPHWSSTTNPSNIIAGLFVTFNNGYSGTAAKTTAYNVRCVRGP